MDTAQVTQFVLFGTIAMAAVAALVALHGRGALSARAFDEAPPREGRLSVADLLITLGLWFFGQAFAVQLLMRVLGGAGVEGIELQTLLLVGVVIGAVPAVVYIVGFRAPLAMAGGADGFGLSMRKLAEAPGHAGWGLLAGLPLVLGMGLATQAALALMGVEPPEMAHQTLESIVNEPWGVARWALILGAVVGAPMIEEIIFRGTVQTAVQTSGIVRSRWSAILVATVPFTAIHVNPAMPATLAALPSIYMLSIVMGWVYERTGNLWAVILMHMAFNALNIGVSIAAFGDV